MAGFICGRRILAAKNNLLKISSRNEASGFMVLLPEIGEDLPNKNPLLNEDTLLPEFNSLTIEKCLPAIGKQTAEFQQEVRNVENNLKESKNINIIEDLIKPLERLFVPFQTTWGVSQTLFYCNQSSMPSSSMLSINKRCYEAESYKFCSQTIYEACKKALESGNLSDEERRIVKLYVDKGRSNGLDLSTNDKEKFDVVVAVCQNKQAQFDYNLRSALTTFEHKVTDPTKMREFPEDFLRSKAVDPTHWKEGPWIIDLAPPVVKTFLEYCPDSLQRFNIWQSDVTKCSAYGPTELENSSVISAITNEKEDLAKKLGFKHWMEINMHDKMIGSMENLENFLKSLLERAYPYQIQEIERLKKFAAENGYASKLEYWDVPYWARRQKNAIYNYSSESLKPYFSFPNVFEGICSLVKDTFNVQIVERKDVSTWDKNVKFFDVYDLDWSESESMGGFYLDPYKLNYKRSPCWDPNIMISIRSRSEICGLKPICSVILENWPPENNKPSLMRLNEVKNLFTNIGHTLQQILTKVNYAEVAGSRNIEWDAVEVSKYVMENLFYEPEALKRVSSHFETGESLDEDTIHNIISSRSHMSGFELCNELYLSRFDMEFNSQRRTWEKIMKKLWKEHFVFPEFKRNSHICSFYESFSGGPGGTYYCHLYSRMLAADIYSAFQEIQQNVGSDVDEQKGSQIVGKRYKDTYFALGGSIPAMEVFRRFRGRDPSLKAFFKVLGMK